jgi:hypothetical protein
LKTISFMRAWQGILCVICFIASPVFGEPAPLVEGPTQEVFAAVKDSVVQIRTLLKGSQSQNSIGSGFYVSDDGLIVTNYHVASSYALEPQTYDMEYVASNGDHGAVTLLAIDVLHDLALLQRKGSALPYLHFHATPAAKGEKLFSFGNPNDLGQVVIDGVNNGLREHSFYDVIHFTGAINGGMSGGPVVEKSGELVGINVASMGQSRGFLVPAQFASALLTRWRGHPVVVPKFRPEIARQLKDHSAALIARLTSKPLPTQASEGYAIPDSPDNYIRCWANESNEAKVFYTVKSYHCSGRAAVYVEDGMTLGDVFFNTSVYHSNILDPFRFGRVLERNYGWLDEANFEIPSEHFTKYACNDSIVKLKGMSVKAALCVRAYRKFPGIYDMKLKVVSLGAKTHAIISKLDLNGIAYADGMRMVKFYMGALKWNG